MSTLKTTDTRPRLANGTVDDSLPKDQASLDSLMQQVKDKILYAQRDLDKWELVGKRYNRKKPEELEALIEEQRLEIFTLKQKIEYKPSGSQKAKGLRLEDISRGQRVVFTDAKDLDVLCEVLQTSRKDGVFVKPVAPHDTIVQIWLEPHELRWPDPKRVYVASGIDGPFAVDGALLQRSEAPQPSGLGAIAGPTTLPQDTPGGENLATEPLGFIPGVSALIYAVRNGIDYFSKLIHFTVASGHDGKPVKIMAAWAGDNLTGVVLGVHGTNPDLFVVDTGRGDLTGRWHTRFWLNCTEFEVLPVVEVTMTPYKQTHLAETPVAKAVTNEPTAFIKGTRVHILEGAHKGQAATVEETIYRSLGVVLCEVLLDKDKFLVGVPMRDLRLIVDSNKVAP